MRLGQNFFPFLPATTIITRGGELAAKYGVTSQQIDDYVKNVTQKKAKAPSRKKTNPRSAIYLDFKDHKVSLTKDTGHPAMETFFKSIGVSGLPLGHAGVVFADSLGNTKYYDYGRYSSGTLGKTADGNYRRINIPNMNIGESLQSFINRLGPYFPNEPTIYAEQYFGTDIDAAENNILRDANNANRDSYNIFTKNCKQVAKQAATTGLNYYNPFYTHGGITPTFIYNYENKTTK